MKTILLLLILSPVLAMPAIGALDDADLDKIRLIVKEEIERDRDQERKIEALTQEIETLKQQRIVQP